MKVTVIGTGYVGLVSGTCFAEIGHQVICVDIDEKKVETLKAGKSPIFEPGLAELMGHNIKSDRLNFSSGYESVKDAQVVFVAVGTPSGEDGSADMKYINVAAQSVAENISDGATIVIKSTVPVGTSCKVKKLISEHTTKQFYLVNNPEFLKEGSAVEDFMRPDRVIIGCDDQAAADIMSELYAPLLRQGNPIYFMSNLSAEMSKYAANCFLATKISFINEIAKLCDQTGADIEEVRKGISSDQRIGKHFLYPGPGYGGSCFPKDVEALIFTAKKHEMDLSIVQAAQDVNDRQKVYMVDKIKQHFGSDLSGKTFAFWGVAFKANTDDVRESPAISMAKEIIHAGGSVKFYDQEASENFLNIMEQKYHNSLKQYDDKYECLKDCDAMVTVTEWREFRIPDFDLVKENLKNPVIFDARNLYDTKVILAKDFRYYAVGKKI